ncbi:MULTISPECIES: cupin domain-containing protein [unclassified Caballeronia]|uniref:cupin domain-containing protein n=1 Tax=unclassified Caballeronia TaxID=2646786 RepID=UPI002865E055|nr:MULTISPECIES: cupin domain-containing protein [unclassified Caballeronia]MDR5814737.1 cupin domain-containing protein [Caballeronia sp. LZ033]MDR5821219.1 cupin domain-containing protein [Caballeronia sp. LZ043]MDR5835094.1 cupin domain-containing protein [Caballeronia sp. LZ034LL]MDR5879373.1 cupin domain-containing protein [Caballeronia sp. LZ032]
MKVIESGKFKAERAWGALDICVMNGTSCRLHWTDTPYKWHVNDGEEVFAVMQGEVRMHVRGPEGERVLTLRAGDIFHAQAGDEHCAEPVGEARILVIEKEGSV